MRNLPAFYKKILVIIMLFVFNVSFAQQIHQRPNFVVILTDDQTYRAIGYNNNLVHTPNLDQLAERIALAPVILNVERRGTPS